MSKFNETNCCPNIVNSWIQEQINISVSKVLKKEPQKHLDFLAEKLRLLAMFNQYEMTEELVIL